MSLRKGRGFSTSKHTKEAPECLPPPNEKIGLCISYLPNDISIDILTRLPLGCVLSCRCVCKTWRNLIKDSEFAKLYFSRAEACPLIRTVGPTHVSRTLYLIDQPPNSDPCHDSSYEDFKPKVIVELDKKLKIPVNNVELAMSEEETNMNLHPKRKRVTKLRSQVHKLNVVNSCNGFLCLSEPLRNSPVMVCNPITGEFIKLPPPTQFECESSLGHINCGLGFCPKTNQYKVIKMLKINKFGTNISEYIDPITGRQRWHSCMAEIHTLGTNTWEMVGYAPSSVYKLGYCTYLNDALHWLYLSYDESSTYLIAAFDFGKEIFQSIAIPHAHRYHMNIRRNRISIGQLRGCLCISDTSDEWSLGIKLWVMKTYGNESSWTIGVTIKIPNRDGIWLYGLYEPIGYFKDGTILFFHPISNSVFSYHPDNSYMKYLKVHGIKSKFEAIPYIPSFYPLKEAIKVDGVEVYNINSRCGGLKLAGESKTVSLVEVTSDTASDFEISQIEYDRRDKPWWLK